MSNRPNPPKSPTLEPPRKSVELEDPGAHELLGGSPLPKTSCYAMMPGYILLTSPLDTSENDDDVFADASEGQRSNPASSSPIPTTRVEKVSGSMVLVPEASIHVYLDR